MEEEDAQVGSRQEGYGETGMAHLLEHLVFKGTPKHPNIPQELTEHGARPNGTTSFDRTNYFETFDATDDNLKWALDLESDSEKLEGRLLDSYTAVSGPDGEYRLEGLNAEAAVMRGNVEHQEAELACLLLSLHIRGFFARLELRGLLQRLLGERHDHHPVAISASREAEHAAGLVSRCL